MADTSLERQSAALYRALTKLMPEGADRLEMNLHDIVTNGGAARSFTENGELNDNAIKQAWRHLAAIGAVENLGPRFKRPVRDPQEIDTASVPASSGRKSPAAKKTAGARKAKRAGKSVAKASRTRRATKAAKKTTGRVSRPRRGTTTKRASRGRQAVKSNGASSAAAAATPTPSGLAGQLSGFQAQLETSLQSLQRLRQEINESYEHLARLEDEHNTIVSDLLAFRENLGDVNQRSFVDSIVGDNLWSYAPRA